MQLETGSRDYAKRLFLTKFQVFHLMMKHCVECLILLLKKKKKILKEEIEDAKMSSFSSDFQTLIKH